MPISRLSEDARLDHIRSAVDQGTQESIEETDQEIDQLEERIAEIKQTLRRRGRINRSEIVISVATKTNWKNTSGFSLLPSLENLRKSSRQLRRTKNSNKISRKLPRSRISYNANRGVREKKRDNGNGIGSQRGTG